jgi:uncharacterized protein YjiK
MFAITLVVPFSHAEEATKPLELVKALPINGPENNQPSGLIMFKGDLFAVSDKHDETVYRIDLGDTTATFVPHLKFKATFPDSVDRLDFEGLTVDGEGNFYIASETSFRILRVSADGKEVTWLSENLKRHGDNVGLFTRRGGYIEGITRRPDGRFILAAERQARGILEVDLGVSPAQVKAFNLDETIVPLKEPRKSSFTGLFWEGDHLFALDRSTEALYKLRYDGEGAEETDVWTYGEIINRDELKYESMKWGLGEGLCLDKDHVYVIVDNNGVARAGNPEDKRPLLLIMKRPQ